MSLKIIPLLCLLLGWTSMIHSQNLLPNPGFEEPNHCYKYQEECCPVGWWSTGPKLTKYQRYTNPKQPNLAAEGQAHMNLLLFDVARPFDRKFIQAPLLCPLVAGQEYIFSAYVKTDFYRIDHIGVFFNDSLFFARNPKALEQVKPKILLHLPTTFPANQWVRLEGRFIADGSEQFIIIGNFDSDEQTNLSMIDPKAIKKRFKSYHPLKRIRYGIDQLSLQAVQTAPSCDLSKSLDLIRQRTHRHTAPPKETPPKPTKALAEIPPVPPTKTIIETPKIKLQKGQPLVLKNVNFEFGTAVLLSSSFEELHLIARTLIQQPELNILIKGHTDNIGDAGHNQLLSKDRAQTVYNFLTRKGVNRKRMRYKGYGEIQPIASNENKEGRQMNRRVEIEVIEE